MSEVFEHRANSFELFGLDFVIDQNLKCWLIEVNMSPACAQRQGQEWLAHMADDMSDGMVNILEEKILRNMASQKIEFHGPIQGKLDQIRAGKFKPDLKHWQKIEFDQAYLRKHIDNDQNQAKIHKALNLTQQVQENPLEIRGFKANLKFERKMDKRYRKF